MVLEARSKLRRAGRYGMTIYLPTALLKDSQFPFRLGQTVTICIDPKRRRLIVEAAPEKEGGKESY